MSSSPSGSTSASAASARLMSSHNVDMADADAECADDEPENVEVDEELPPLLGLEASGLPRPFLSLSSTSLSSPFVTPTSSSSPSSSSSSLSPSFLSLPIELHTKVLLLVDPSDLLSYSRTCKTCWKYAESQHLWRHQWQKLSRKTPFSFLPTSSLIELGVNFKDMCRRLWKVMVSESCAFGGLTPSKCPSCKEFTCTQSCVVDEQGLYRVAVDIGGKMTWLITPQHSLKRHLSMIAVPKLLKCYDCDTTLNRHEMRCDCVPSPQDANPSLRPATSAPMSNREPYCHNRLMSSHTALEYCSQPLGQLWVQPVFSQPFCLFCEDDRVNRLLCEREMVSSTKHKMKSGVAGVRPPYFATSITGDEEFRNYSAVLPLTNGYCRDTATILGAENLDLLSPLLSLEQEEAFPVAKAFLTHLLKQYKMVDDLQRPNCALILTYAKLSMGVKEALLKFLFEEMKISRLCLLPKALAICQLFDVHTCVVVDSGATSTFVWVVVDGKVDEEKTQSRAVGGWQLSQLLKQALSWKDNNKLASGATVSSLDTSAVKQNCRLSLNLAREGEDRHRRHNGEGIGGAGGGALGTTLHIKSQRDAQRKLELTEVTMSSELYLAPETMYKSLDLPFLVQEATKDLPDHLVKDCFSNILVTGGNTDLQGFTQRFSSDLREKMPEHAPIINVCPFPTGNNSWNTVMGAYSIKVVPSYEDILHLHETGAPLWMSREEYVLFGCQQMAS